MPHYTAHVTDADTDANSPGRAASRAASLLRALGALEIPLFLLLAMGYAWVASLTPQQLAERVQARELSLRQAQVLAEAQPAAGRIAAAAVMIGVLPGVAYVAMSFGVRRGASLAVLGSLLLAATQLIAFTAAVVERLLSALGGGNPLIVTVTVLLGGTLVGLLGAAVYWLWRAGGGRDQEIRKS
jgi:hypothetical protein